MAKNGKAEKFALGCGSGCLAYCTINLVYLGENGLVYIKVPSFLN